jgi:hypothetical protein
MQTDIFFVCFFGRGSAMKRSIKFLFVNPMNNTVGFSMALGTSLGNLTTTASQTSAKRTCCWLQSLQSRCGKAQTPFYFTVIMKLLNRVLIIVQPLAVSLFPAHVALICKHPDLDRHNLSSVMSISVIDQSTQSTSSRFLTSCRICFPFTT